MFTLKKANKVEENEEKVVTGYTPFETNIYDATIKVLYLTQSKAGAFAGNLIAEIDGKELRTNFYFTNRNGENFYTKDGKNFELPGFITINELCFMATGQGYEDQEIEEKIIKRYNPEKKAEENMPTPVMTGMTGQKVKLALEHIIENKNALNQNTNQYEPTNDKREFNEIYKSFDADRCGTYTEHKKDHGIGDYAAEFMDKKAGKVNNKFKEVSGQSGVSSGRPSQGGGGENSPKKSLFGNK